MMILKNRQYRIKLDTPNGMEAREISGRRLLKIIRKQLKHCKRFECECYSMKFDLNTLYVELIGGVK